MSDYVMDADYILEYQEKVQIELSLTGLPPSGPPGPPGPSGGSAYTHVQVAPAATWTIIHGLERVPYSVTVVIEDEIADTDVHLDATTVVLTFAEPTSGQAYIL